MKNVKKFFNILSIKLTRVTENDTIIIQKDKGGAVMRQSEVKKKAEEFCEQNGIKSYPVEIVRICRENGLKVFEEYLDSDISGLIVVDDKEWDKYGADKFIIVNLAESAVRRRFTIAHELAHYILHRNGNRLYAHRDMTNDGTVKNSIEQEANYFAANVLMPESLIRDKVDDLKSEVWGKLPNFVLIREIADHFVVSESAAEVRLKQLEII